MSQATPAKTTPAEQTASMKPALQREHQWLQQLVGDWTYETSEPAQPGQPNKKYTGTEHVRSIGGIWVQAEGKGEMPGGGAATTLMTLGYDPARKRIVGSWIGSMMTHQWVYDGELDTARNVLVLNSEGPSMADDGTMSLYRDTIELKGDERTLTASVQGKDGSWQSFMTVKYRRATRSA